MTLTSSRRTASVGPVPVAGWQNRISGERDLLRLHDGPGRHLLLTTSEREVISKQRRGRPLSLTLEGSSLVSRERTRSPGRRYRLILSLVSNERWTELEREFLARGARDQIDIERYELAGGVDQLVSLLVHRERRADSILVEPRYEQLITIDITTGDRVQLSELIGSGPFQEIRRSIRQALGTEPSGLRPSWGARIDDSFAISLASGGASYEITVGIPRDDGPDINVFKFELRRTAEIDALLREGLGTHRDRISTELERLLSARLAGEGTVIPSITTLLAGPDLSAWLLERGWKEFSDPSRPTDRVLRLGRPKLGGAGQEARYQQDGTTVLTSVVHPFAETLRAAAGAIEHRASDLASPRTLTPLELKQALEPLVEDLAFAD